MNFIEFTKENWSFDVNEQQYWIKIPKLEINNHIKSLQVVNNDGSFSDADCEIQEELSVFIISFEYPVNLRVNF